MSCKYCSNEEENKKLMTTDCDEINFDIYVSANAPLLVAMGSNWVDSSQVEINYCPMCGRKLKESKQ